MPDPGVVQDQGRIRMWGGSGCGVVLRAGSLVGTGEAGLLDRQRVEATIEQHSQPAHRPEIPHPSRGLREAKDCGSLRRGEVFEMPQQDDLPVVLVEQFTAAANRRSNSCQVAAAAGVSSRSASCPIRSACE